MAIHILGISAYYHDSAAALLRDGRIMAAAQEERFSRIKHDHRFPRQAAGYCLKEAGISTSELDFVIFYDKPFLKFTRLLETYLSYAPTGLASFIKAMPLWLRQKLWIPDLIEKELGYSGKVLFAGHHESHAASAFFPSPFREAAFLTMDGVGEWATSSFGTGKDNRVEILSELHFPHSLGLLYSAFTYFTGFKVNSGEYKLMGLAPYGQPRYAQKIYDQLIDLKEDGSFKMNMDYFNYAAGLTMTSRKFNRLFDGPPRRPESPITRREMDLARSIQEVTEEIMLRMAAHVKKVTAQKNLCLAGGVALNCVGNGRLLRSGLFERIWIQPAAGDAGGALGAAYIAWHHYLQKERQPASSGDAQQGSYLGPAFSNEEIEIFLKENDCVYKWLDTASLLELVADELQAGKVVGWFQSRMEFGPRALGNRSILGDPRSPDMQRRMNLKIKFRESFRPFAPSVLKEQAGHWFDLDVESPYMLLVADVRPGQRIPPSETDEQLHGVQKVNAVRSKIPAVTHVDYSARIQTVRRDTNPLYYGLIETFYKKTGCPLLVNTSFNVRGEPIVCSPREAYACFMRTHMDVLVLGNFIMHKEKQQKPVESKEWQTEYELD